MTISTKALELIKHYEGFSPTPYRCPGGYITIGYGHVIEKGEVFALPMPLTLAEKILKQDIAKAEKALAKNIKIPLTTNQRGALISFIFNIGEGAFSRSTLCRKVNAGLHQEVPNELRRWVWSNGEKLPGLMKRREEEAAMYISPRL